MKSTLGILISGLLGIAAGIAVAYSRDADPGPQYERLMRTAANVGNATSAPTVEKAETAGVVVEGGEHFEFGVMDRGETRSHTFMFHNATDQPLQLTVGSTTCKCTVGELGDDTIAPGETGEVNLEWIAKSYDKEFQQSATIETSDPIRPKIILSVSGKVLQLVQPDPQGVYVNDIPFGVEKEQRIVIYSFQQGDDLRIIDHEYDDETTAEFFQLDWEKVDLTELEYAPESAVSAVDCRLKVLPGLPYGKVNQSLRITTDAQRSAVVEIPIAGRVVSDLIVAGTGYVESSGILKLGRVLQEKGLTRNLRIMARRADVHPVEITSIKCEPEGIFQAEAGEPRSLKDGTVMMFPLKLTIPPGAREVSYLAAWQANRKDGDRNDAPGGQANRARFAVHRDW